MFANFLLVCKEYALFSSRSQRIKILDKVTKKNGCLGLCLQGGIFSLAV